MVDFYHFLPQHLTVYSAHAVTPDILHALIVYATYLLQ